MSKPKVRPFPIVRGGCSCGLIRYQLEAAPLYCYACHCSDCQKESGSVFAPAATIEFDKVTSIGKQPPDELTVKVHDHSRSIAACPNCRNILWSSGSYAPATLNVCIGTLDLPGLFEPDIHIFIAGKVPWLHLPPNTKTMRGDMDRAKVWPKASLARLETCMKRWEAKQKELKDARESGDAEANEEDRTPTNGSPEEKDEDDEFDEEFDKRQDEIEKALLERLEMLSLKLSHQEEEKKQEKKQEDPQEGRA